MKEYEDTNPLYYPLLYLMHTSSETIYALRSPPFVCRPIYPGTRLLHGRASAMFAEIPCKCCLDERTNELNDILIGIGPFHVISFV